VRALSGQLPERSARELSDVNHPVVSVIIPTRNTWPSLQNCLESLASQISPPSFEVIVVDDGSRCGAPESVMDWASSIDLRVRHQVHQGVSAARNHGIRLARADILLFVDSDCLVEAHCLNALAGHLACYPEEKAFQLQIRADHSNLVGRAEDLNLVTLEQQKLLPNGRILWLNTAGFACRLEQSTRALGLFDVRAARAQDTLLLAALVQQNQPPRFVPEAIVKHAVNLTPTQYIVKGFRTAYLEGNTFRIMVADHTPVHSNDQERRRILQAMWRTSREKTFGRLAALVVFSRHAMKLLGKLVYHLFPPKAQ
jgi:hypothetical protein